MEMEKNNRLSYIDRVNSLKAEMLAKIEYALKQGKKLEDLELLDDYYNDGEEEVQVESAYLESDGSVMAELNGYSSYESYGVPLEELSMYTIGAIADKAAHVLEISEED